VEPRPHPVQARADPAPDAHGIDAWVIPEFAWDPSGQRLLWTQNKFRSGHRVDQACVARRIRADYVSRLSGVRKLGDIPFTLPDEMREQAVELLRNPRGFAHAGLGCGGDDPTQTPNWQQATVIGHYLP